MSSMNEKKLLREGWFDSITSLFKGGKRMSGDTQKIAGAWISEKELELGEDLDDSLKDQIHQFIDSRYERALNVYKDDPNPVRKTVMVLVRLLDKKFGPMIDRYYQNSSREIE